LSQEITLLPEDVVRWIAAGEVIDSLAAVVRELAENALDAGATRITVALWMDQWRVRVADNGGGMSLTDLRQAATAHSTSKIRDRQDLWHITSLGFRGEALHSLAQLSQLQIASRPLSAPTTANSSDSTLGWLSTYDVQGEVTQLEPVAIAPGTIVTADRIFANLPQRRQGLPPAPQQLRAIQLMIHQLALCHPQVTWQVQQSDREWFTLFPGNSPRQLLPQMLRSVQISDLQELDLDLQVGPENPHDPRQPGKIYVLVGLPDRCHRGRPDWIKVAVNGRLVQIPALEQAILSGFRRTLPRDRFPVCLIHLRVPPEQVDWNRHPAKSEIYLHHLAQWQATVEAAIAQALRLNPDSLPDQVQTSRVSAVLKVAESGGSYRGADLQQANSTDEMPSLQPLKVLAQVHQTYILVEHPTGIWLIEQHIAHERVLFEDLCDRWHLEPLSNPVILQALTTSQVEQLQALGVEIEPFGEQTWMVRSVPAMLATREDCADALIELSLGGDLASAQAAIACRSAIRNGTPLSQADMQTLIDRWQKTRNFRTCPHGRPICLSLEESSLARFFRRHWMVGKSHGI
jgi:DNA mismatch repair protein MutL